MQRPSSSDYEILELIGRGAFNLIYKVRHQQTNVIYALKQISLNNALETGHLPQSAFLEMKLLQLLNSPYILKVYEVFPIKTQLGLVVEYMEMDLSQFLQRLERPLNSQEIKSILYMILLGIAYCHERYVIHRDLKPGNLLFHQNGKLKLCDFGLATLYLDSQRSYSHQISTRWYRAPEVLYGGRHYDYAIDLWAIGCIFGEILGNKVLFQGMNDIDQLSKIIQLRGN